MSLFGSGAGPESGATGGSGAAGAGAMSAGASVVTELVLTDTGIDVPASDELSGSGESDGATVSAGAGGTKAGSPEVWISIIGAPVLAADVLMSLSIAISLFITVFVLA